MKIEIYRCNYCGKEINGDYLSKRGWISINEDGLSVSGGKTGGQEGILSRLAVSVTIPEAYTKTLDFCCLGCFVKWLFLSEETDCSKDVNEFSLLKEALMSLVEDVYLGKLIAECLKLKSGEQTN